MAGAGEPLRPHRPETRLATAHSLGRLLVFWHKVTLPTLRDAQGTRGQLNDTKGLVEPSPVVACCAAAAVEAGLLAGHAGRLHGGSFFKPVVPGDGAGAALIAAGLSRP